MVECSRLYSPPVRSTSMWIERLSKKKSVRVCILNEKIEGCMVHWNGVHTSPCSGPENGCDGCKTGYPKNAKAFCHCFNSETMQHLVLEMPPETWRNLLASIGESETMRGIRARFYRVGGLASGVKFELEPRWEFVSQKQLPPGLDPIPFVQRLWDMVKNKKPIKEVSDA